MGCAWENCTGHGLFYLQSRLPTAASSSSSSKQPQEQGAAKGATKLQMPSVARHHEGSVSAFAGKTPAPVKVAAKTATGSN